MKTPFIAVLLIALCILLIGCESQADRDAEAAAAAALNATNTIKPRDWSNVTIASWNLQRYGDLKSLNRDANIVIADILDDYDVIALQEIQGNESIDRLVAFMPGYAVVESKPIGRTKYKESYAILYRQEITLTGSSQVADPFDVFEREPFAAAFRTPITNYEFTILNVHIKPDDAVNELRTLDAHFTSRPEDFDSRLFIVGDLNADCAYYDIGIAFKEESWLITDDKDTTTGRSDCAYDRIITGDKTVRVLRAGVYNDTKYTPYELASISDHYPIYATISTTEATT